LFCLCLIPLGGLFRTAGIIGFSINMLAGVFEMLPISPCDGKEVREWSWVIWALVFLPLMVIYLIVTF
jgi:Zn-dependent protease